MFTNYVRRAVASGRGCDGLRVCRDTFVTTDAPHRRLHFDVVG